MLAQQSTKCNVCNIISLKNETKTYKKLKKEKKLRKKRKRKRKKKIKEKKIKEKSKRKKNEKNLLSTNKKNPLSFFLSILIAVSVISFKDGSFVAFLSASYSIWSRLNSPIKETDIKQYATMYNIH